MQRDRLHELAGRFLGAWNSQQVEAVLACYTDEVAYRDPSTRGEIAGAGAMRRYLVKLFAAWRMRWSLRAAYPLAVEEGVAVLWHASIQRADGGPAVEVDGMDLLLMAGDRIRRNEVYFDRALLAPLLEP
jgi:ketosteroid isomerase-like protein